VPRDTALDELDQIRRIAHAPRVFCVDRPIHIMERIADVPEVVEEREHLNVLIDRIAGTRSVLQLLETDEQRDKWHEVAALSSTQALDSTLTCTRQQLPIFLDRHAKHIFGFGGNQSGKTHVGGHWIWDRMLANSGLYLWLAPTLEKTQVGVEKLTRTTEWAKSIIPPELLVSSPTTERSGDQNTRLVDGNVVSYRYCSREGGNLKGLTGVRAVVMDEGTEVPHQINFTIATNRLLLSGGQMFVPTTPVKGHWLEERDANTMDYAAIEQHVAAGHKRPAAAKVVLSVYDNPWVSKEETDRTIESLGGIDDPRVKREVLGQWVRDGKLLWTHFNEERHLVHWGSPDVERYGYVDITNVIGRRLFRGMTRARTFRWIGGQDFNFNPYSLAALRFIVPKDLDHADPDNWILYVEDTIIKRAKSTAEFGDWLASQAGVWHGRGMRRDAFAGMHIVCDGQGFYKNRDLRANVSNDAEEMKKAGFIVRPPKYTVPNKKPANPPRDVRIGFFNDLLYRNRVLINAASMRDSTRNAELIESLQTATQGKPKPGTAADRRAGITDGVAYPAYAALWRAPKKAANDEGPGITAAGWG